MTRNWVQAITIFIGASAQKLGEHLESSRVDLLSVVFSRARGGAERVPLAAECSGLTRGW